MRRTKKLILLMVILPWLSVPFIGTRSFKRFLPGALFMCSFLLVEASSLRGENGGGFQASSSQTF
jgi:hypothetical protein